MRVLYGGWWTVGVALLLVAIGIGQTIADPSRWPSVVSGFILACFALAIAALAESNIQLERAQRDSAIAALQSVSSDPEVQPEP